MTTELYQSILEGVKDGSIVPYLGPDVLRDVKSKLDNSPMPATSDSLILAMNNGQEMAPRLMYEFPRAAMHLENKKGRSFIEKFLTKTYAETAWGDSPFHQWLYSLRPQYAVDTNRDMILQKTYQEQPHLLVVGVARIAAHPYRFDIYQWQDGQYTTVEPEQADATLPILFKPLGSPEPKPNYIASDADFVDYITELMGGFAIPSFLKDIRIGKKYLFLGCHFTRDTERMIMSDIIYGADGNAGWALIKDPTEKEKKYCSKKNIEVIDDDWSNFVNAVEVALSETA